MIRDKRSLWHRNENCALKRIFTHRDLPDNKILQEIIKHWHKIPFKHPSHSNQHQRDEFYRSVHLALIPVYHALQVINKTKRQSESPRLWKSSRREKSAFGMRIFGENLSFSGFAASENAISSIEEDFHYGWQRFEESIWSLSFQNIGCKLFAFVYFFYRWTDPSSTLHWRTRTDYNGTETGWTIQSG